MIAEPFAVRSARMTSTRTRCGLLALFALLICSLAAVPVHANDWRVITAGGELTNVILVSVVSDTLVVAHRGLMQGVPIASVTRLIRRDNTWGRISGATAGIATGGLLGLFLELTGSSGSAWRSTGREGVMMALGAVVGGTIGLAWGGSDYDVTSYDVSAMDVASRRDAISRLIAETGGK